MSSLISVDIDPIFFKLAGNKDMHNIMNEFEFRPDQTIDYGVSCPWASKKYPYRPYNGEKAVSTFSLLFLIGSFWYFHVTRTKLGWVWIFWNEIWPWHIGLRWAIVALWATCFSYLSTFWKFHPGESLKMTIFNSLFKQSSKCSKSYDMGEMFGNFIWFKGNENLKNSIQNREMPLE